MAKNHHSSRAHSRTTKSLVLEKTPRPRSIRELITLGGLALVSTTVWSATEKASNEIWINPGDLQGVCSKDIDQDGDFDIFTIYPEIVNIIENTGTPASPQFAKPELFISNQNQFKLNQLGLNDCLKYESSSASIDIDADGDLDLFTGSSSKSGEFLNYAENINSTEHPSYVYKDPQDLFGLPSNVENFIFKDIDGDGDQDFFSDFNSYNSIFYENIGSPESAIFVQQNINPIKPLCKNTSGSFNDYGFIIDLNNDGEWDMLCRNSNNNFEYIQSSAAGYLPEKNVFTAHIPTLFSSIQPLDIDEDGDIDIIAQSYNQIALYTNISTDSTPQFDRGQIYPLPEQTNLTFFSDLNGDHSLDLLFSSYSTPLLGYSTNTGNNISPSFDLSSSSPEFEQCNNSLFNFSNLTENADSFSVIFNIENIALIDIDNDNDLDLFAQIDFFDSNTLIVFCENQGSSIDPFFSSAIRNPFGLSAPSYSPTLSFGDRDGDGDFDAWVNNTFFDNIGTPKKAMFRQISHVPGFSGDSLNSVADISGNGQIDSIFTGENNLRLLHNALQPATIIAAAIHPYGDILLATSNASHVQLQQCQLSGDQCSKNIFLPTAAKELSLNTGDFNGDGTEDIVLAMVDADGLLNIQIFNSELKLIGSHSGGLAHSISVSAGQLDSDRPEEYVVSFVQPDEQIVAITFNLDSTIVGTAKILEPGKQPRIDVGKFSSSNDSFVLAYLTMENQIKTATFHGDGTLINQGVGGEAHYINVSKADILPSQQDDYVVSLVDLNGVAALRGYSSNGALLGGINGSISQQPTVVSGIFPGKNSSGLAVSLIQPDKRPAIVFLDNHGRYIARGIGGTTASVATNILFDVDSDDIDDGILIYIDESGTVRWHIFGSNGAKK